MPMISSTLQLRHLLSNEVTLGRLVKSKRIHDWLNSEPLSVNLEYGSDFFDDLDWHNVRGAYADRSGWNLLDNQCVVK